MSNAVAAPPAAARSSLLRRLPIVLLLLAALVIAGFWLWQDQDMERVVRVTGTIMTLQALIALLALWVLLLSGWRWWVRLAVLILVPLIVAAAGVASIRKVEFTGDMVPFVEFRWQPTREDILEASRRQQAGGPPLTAPMLQAKPSDYPEYRGTLRDGIVHGPLLARDWTLSPPRKLWRQPVGGGYASFAVVGNVAVTIEQRRDKEAVVCYDTATGRERWIHAYDADFSERMGGEGPRATPTIKDGDVYSLGATGMLVCLDAATGKPKWSVNILKKDENSEENINVQWGMSGSPLVYDKVVVVNPGKQSPATAGKALVVYDRTTGQPVWSAGDTQAGYSSPMLATLAGQRLVLLFDGKELGGYDAAKGTKLWHHPWKTDFDINVAQPVVLPGDRVFISSGYGKGCAMLKTSDAGGQWSVKELWKNTLMRCRFTSPVEYKGHLYGLDEGILACLDAETGKRTWKDGRYGNGQLLLSDGLLVILSEEGDLALVEAKPDAYQELGRMSALKGRTWNHLALADGKAYVRNHLEMACYDLTETKTDRGQDWP